LLLKWLKQTYGEETVTYQVPGCINPQTNRSLPFDFGIVDPVSSRRVLVELDGRIGHFGMDFHGNETQEHALRDLYKEHWAVSHGHSVVRVLQEDVWFNCSDWQGYLKESIYHALAGSIPTVFCPKGMPEYASGIYAELRKADANKALI
jgi:very-short-patch-repair endonuclease